jgi:hypothetical protein
MLFYDAYFTFIIIPWWQRAAADEFNDEVSNVMRKNIMEATISTSVKTISGY